MTTKAHLRRLGLAASLAVCVAATIVIAGLQRGHPANRPDLLVGAVWLASSAVGQVTLVDGLTAEVAAAARVTKDGGRIVVRQQGQNAYVLDLDGQVIRVDGGTLSRRRQPSPTIVRAGAGVFATRDAVYVLDPQRTQVRTADPVDLSPRGQSLAPDESRASAATDGHRLWVLDRNDGALARFTPGRVSPWRTRPSIGRAALGSTRLAMTGSDPIVVNAATRTAYLLSGDDASVVATVPIEVDPRDLVSGGQRRRLLVSRPATGGFLWCDFDPGSCRGPLAVGRPGADLGPAIEAHQHAFVPDSTAGVVHIVNLVTGEIGHTEPLFEHPTPFELVSRAGIVFYNDPASEQAGTVDPDGSVRRVDKYDPRHPEPPDEGNDDTTSGPDPTPSATARPDGPVNPSAGSDPSASPDPRSTRTTPSPVPVPTQTATDTGPPRIVRIRQTPASPVIGEQVTFEADLAGLAPLTRQWSVRRLPDGAERPVSSQVALRHVFDAAGTYQVSLTVARESDTDRRDVQVSVAFAAPTVRCGEVITANVTLRVDLRCPRDGLRVGADDITIDLNGHTLSGPGTAESVGIRNELYPSLIIRDGTVSNFAVGIYIGSGSSLSDTPGARIEGVNSRGIVADHASRLAIRGGRITAGGPSTRTGNGRPYLTFATGASVEEVDLPDGLGLDNTRNSRVVGCVITGPVFIPNSNGVRMSGNTFVDAEIGVSQSNDFEFVGNNLTRTGMSFNNSSRLPVIRNNTFRGADTAVTLRKAAWGASVTGNLFEGNKVGFLSEQFPNVPGQEISRNRFIDNAVAGVLILVPEGSTAVVTITDNEFRRNGDDSDGRTDSHGSVVDDGLHVDAPAGADVTIADNRTFNNHDHGIEAVPGTVVDGGGNSSSGDPSGCLGVRCD